MTYAPPLGYRTCTIEGCRKPHRARGFCDAHWKRWRRHGDPFGGGTSIGEAQRFLREIVLPFDGDECLIWPYTKNNKGYAQIWHGGRLQLVSRLACEARNGPPPTPSYETAHSCGQGHEGCVNPKHLRWVTPKQNQADKLIHGTHNRGERHSMAKLTEADVHQIRALKGQALQREIAKRFRVSHTQISKIHLGETWGWLA